MKILVLGDPHFKEENLHWLQNTCDEIIEIIKKEQVELCICLGDTLDKHKTIFSQALYLATKFFFDISDLCHLVILIGNHDRINKHDFLTNIHPFFGLSRTPNITVAGNVVWDQQRNFIYVPYVYPGRFIEALETVGYHPAKSNKKPKYIFAHQEFWGSNYGLKEFSKEGDRWDPTYPQVISGHIHKHQQLENIYYVGTFYQENYGEDIDKAILLINGEDFKRIRLKTPCLRITVDLTMEQLVNFKDWIPTDSIKSKSKEKKEGTLVRAIIHCDATENKSLTTNPHYVSLCQLVDKVEKVVTSDKLNAAALMTGVEIPTGKKLTIEEVVIKLLEEDLETQEIFKSLIGQ